MTDRISIALNFQIIIYIIIKNQSKNEQFINQKSQQNV